MSKLEARRITSGVIWADNITSNRLAASEVIVGRIQVEGLGMPMVSEPPLREVELRCPTGPRKLFAKLRLAGEQPSVTSDNLVEMACQDCRRRMRGEGRQVSLVLHRFNIVGDLIETVSVDKEDTD